MGTRPHTGSWGQGSWLLAMVAQQGCGGEGHLAPEDATSMGPSSFLPQVWGGKGRFVGWNREERVEGEEISGGRGVPPVQTALISLKRKLLSSLSYSITCRGMKYSARNKILLSRAVMG